MTTALPLDDLSPEVRRIQYPLQLRTLTVAATETLTPHLRRITLCGDSLADLHSEGFDDHVKLLLPAPGQTTVTLPPMGPDGRPDRAAATGPAPIARDYTPRHIDRAARRLQIDFCLHGDGPAARWAAQVQVGDPAWVAGPRGSRVLSTDLDWQWLVGDESAWPAMARRLEELPARVAVTVVLETATADEPLPPLALQAHHRLVRVTRPTDGDLTAPLLAALAALPTPEGRGHAWVAAESRTARAAREVLVQQHGLLKGQVKAAGYWQRGAAGQHENLTD